MKENTMIRATYAVIAATLLLPVAATAQITEIPEGVEVPTFLEYYPPSTLVVPENPVTSARFPFIDVHNHQFRMGAGQDLAEVTAEMDKLNMAVMVNLSGRGFRRIENEDGTTTFDLNTSDYFKAAIDHARATAPGRFAVFTNLSTNGIDNPDWTERTAEQLDLLHTLRPQGRPRKLLAGLA